MWVVQSYGVVGTESDGGPFNVANRVTSRGVTRHAEDAHVLEKVELLLHPLSTPRNTNRETLSLRSRQLDTVINAVRDDASLES